MSHALPEHVLIVNYTVENIPYVSAANRFEASCLDKSICQLTLHYGFMDSISIPRALSLANLMKILPFQINIDEAIYLVEVPNIVTSREMKTMYFFWQQKMFVYMSRNFSANLNIEFYKLPFNRTIAIGTYCMI